MNPNRHLKGRPAIYGIRNLADGKIYVGKTHCMYRRCSQYIYDFQNNRNLNHYLYASMKKYGIDKFEMFPLEFCESCLLSENELKWILDLRSYDRSNGYNLRIDSSSGMLAHESTRALQSENLKTQWVNGTRDKHSEKLKASWVKASPDRRNGQSDRLRTTLTKYEYQVEHPSGLVETCNYGRLKEIGLKYSVVNMCRSGMNKTSCKGFKVTRSLLCT